MRLIWFSLLSIPSSLFAQNISGTIYEDGSTLEQVSVLNITQNFETFSNDNGFFTIKAIENDTILFSSLFHIEKKILVTDDYLDKEVTIQLEQKINKLEEVIISNYSFDEEQFNSNFKSQILYDVENNMQAYEQASNGNVDFRKIFKRISKLLSKNKKNKSSIKPNYLAHSELKLLFLKQEFNNEKLTNLLKIKEENVYLFMDFCTMKIESVLLEEKNNLLLLDKLIDLSMEFRKLSAQ